MLKDQRQRNLNTCEYRFYSTFTGFFYLAFKGREMPRFQIDDNEESTKTESQKNFTNLKYWKSMLVMIFIYYALSCGLEGFFQVLIF